MEKLFLNPLELPNWEQSFSQIVTVCSDSTKTIYLSGQVAMDQHNQLVGQDDLARQAIQAFQNVEKALASVGATTTDVVKLTIYVKDYKAADASSISEALRNTFPPKHLPASTWLGVQSLALEGLLIEIDAIAMTEV